MKRRAFLGGLAAALGTAGAGAAIARGRRQDGSRVLRIGVMANLTHAPVLAGLGTGRVAEALAPVRIETLLFRAGPRVTEALIGGAIDAGTAGPAPIVVHHSRHAQDLGGGVTEAAARAARKGLLILSGCCSGGASLVVTASSGIVRASDLRGKRLAVTGLGTTQDVALRVYLREAGLRDRTAGGDVDVLAISGATVLEQMKRGELHGAWLAEPWATRMVRELGAVRLVDERELWPERRFATAVLACRAADAADPALARLTRALEHEVEEARRDPAAALASAHAELKRRMGNPGSLELFGRAAKLLDFTSDPLRASIERFGEHAASFHLCAPNPTVGLFAGSAIAIRPPE